MNRQKAEQLYNSGKEPTLKALMELDDEVDRLKKLVASLSGNSTNSSRPPSSDGPRVKRPIKEPTGRKPGGQPGHQGHKRVLLPAGQMDEIIDLVPYICEKCGTALDASVNPAYGDPIRYQYFELPQKRIWKREYRSHALGCTCGHTTRAALPQEVSQSQFGPELHAMSAVLTFTHRVSRRGISEILSTLFDLDISVGAIEAMKNRVSEAIAPVAESIEKQLPHQEHINIDETGWKDKGQKRWLWVFVSAMSVVFKISPSRGSQVLEALLGKMFAGKMGSDDFSCYRKYTGGIRWQLCWAHIIRKLKGLKESRSSPSAVAFADLLLTEARYLFSYWHLFTQGAFDRTFLRSRMREIRSEIESHCANYSSDNDKAVKTRALKIQGQLDNLFTFVNSPGVEPTNNAAERAIRPSVQWRKLCFGNQSDSGERFTERILTIIHTCKKQNINPHRFLCDVMTSAFNNTPVPLLG